VKKNSRSRHPSLQNDPTGNRSPRGLAMIAQSFDTRTLANMEIALDRTCANIPEGQKHTVRRYVAARIARCARMGQRTLAALSQAGQVAAAELRQRKAVRVAGALGKIR
jgi:hypothetical protein